MRILTVSTAILALGLAGSVFAAGDLSRTDIQTVTLEMGTTDDGDMYFTPSDLTFETGRAYKLHMVNVDEIKHEVSLGELGEKIFTRKIEIETADGDLIAEIKGQIHEVEIGPHQAVDWYFVPVQTMDDAEIKCEIEGHYDAGMHAMARVN